MTNTDSASLMFIIMADKSCDLGEREMRNVMLKFFLENENYNRLDTSHDFFNHFNKIVVKVGLYDFDSVEHGIICAVNVNPKEYHELCGILHRTNKKLKGVRNGTEGMDFDNYASRILSLEEVKEGTDRFANKKQTILFSE